MTPMLSDGNFSKCVIAALVRRLGPEDISIFQHELDEVAYGKLLEGVDENGNFLLRFVPAEQANVKQ